MVLVHPSKRRRLNTGDQLTHRDYTVGWICALPCELAAAKAMFDDVHEMLPNPPHDKNVYSFGSISSHNVVVTILPLGNYGTTAAATVAIRMTSTFKSISIPLLVGVGGGVPGQPDMRLGDIAVSVPSSGQPAIIQHDYGKALPSGRLQRTGHLDNPADQVLAAVARVQASHKAGPSRVPAILENVLQNADLLKHGFAHPGSDKDVLYLYSCEHSRGTKECTQCSVNIVQRQPRPNQGPRIHYGSIASGNLVVKSAVVRNRIVSELGVICFEMEAAGIMNCFPALVVKGICDYCDGQKDKKFQPYAALTAAAFAKELLMYVPHTMVNQTEDTILKSVVEPYLDGFVRELDFAESQSRLMNVKKAHPRTLNWISTNKTYLNWLDHEQMKSHNGLLWIKGKPGAGKSTLMKYILSEAESSNHVISFFFNARGTELQRTALGMYRSLVAQLVRLFPELWQSVNLLKIRRLTHDVGVLTAIFDEVVAHIRQPFFCFIDALDEGSEDEIRELMEQFETIMNGNSIIRVCCSSRYYPNISINIGLELRLDIECGHLIDVQNYVEAKLRIGKSQEAEDIKKDIVNKAGGIFLWVVLVIQILIREYDRGRVHALKMKLDEIPAELGDLIHDILVRNNEDLEHLAICLQWVLFSNRPLSLCEFYHAMFAADDRYSLGAISPGVTEDDMARFVLNCSKGLLETTQQAQTQVQVIHESVREFLLGNTMIEIWSGFAALAMNRSHDMLAKSCLRYLITENKYRTRNNLYNDSQSEIDSSRFRFPLRDYAAAEMLKHADAAQEYGISQLATLKYMTEQPNICPDGHLTLTRQLARYGKKHLFAGYLAGDIDARVSADHWAWEIVVSSKQGYADIAHMLLVSDAVGHTVPRQVLERFTILGRRSFNNEDENSRLLRLLKQSGLGLCLLDNAEWVCKQDAGWLETLSAMLEKSPPSIS